MVVKIFGDVKGACPQRVMACFFEKDIDFEIVHVGLDSGDHKKPEFLARQPFGQVPAIEDGDFKLFDSRAIVKYYSTKYANIGPNLTGKTLEEKAVVDQWIEVESHNFNDLVQPIVFNVVVLPRIGGKTDEEFVKTAKKKLENVLDVYEERLSKTKYLGGEEFTLADLSHLPALRYLMSEDGLSELVSERKHLKGWWDDISNRPAWKKVLKIIGV